jgi:uncharacterized DUF497 family protein
MDWTWDPDKNRENIRKHGIRFETSMLALLDPNRVMEEDYFSAEQLWRTTGAVELDILLVVHTLPPTEVEPGRIISARIATRGERNRYEEEYG